MGAESRQGVSLRGLAQPHVFRSAGDVLMLEQRPQGEDEVRVDSAELHLATHARQRQCRQPRRLLPEGGVPILPRKSGVSTHGPGTSWSRSSCS